MNFYKKITSVISQKTHQEMVLLSVSGLTALCFFPFIIVRLVTNDWNIAALNAIAAGVMSTFFIYVYRTRKTDITSIGLSIFLMGFILIDIFLAGKIIIYWFYPTLIATYYLNPHKIALEISLITITILAIIIYPLTLPIEFAIIIMSTLILNFFSFFIFRSITHTNDKLENLATIDSLTQCYNRRALETQILELINKYNRSSFPLCLIIFDLDHFKVVNDNYGHLVGDDVLKEISQIVMNNTRSFEKIYRYGGEEFIVLPLEVEIKEAMLLANKLRSLIENHTFSSNLKLTVSLGVAQYKKDETGDDWIKRADFALYKAKQSGRNIAVCDRS